jgi:hypothetical protein
MEVMIVLTSGRVEKHPRVTSSAFPPPIFVETILVSLFHVSPLPCLAIVEGGIYIGNLGQAEHLETNIDDVGGSRIK